jgi:hypothetical protein
LDVETGKLGIPEPLESLEEFSYRIPPQLAEERIGKNDTNECLGYDSCPRDRTEI